MGQRIEEDELLAAVDLGSNSFHMVVARHSLGQLSIVDRIKETVRLATGLDGQGGLNEESLERALGCLSRFGERLRGLPGHRVRAIATNTVRQLRTPQRFLLPAETALGHGIEVVSGREEARLIYLGVAQGHPTNHQRRLVMDIGGGSTEFIIGQGAQPLERESLQMGCIATTRRFFPNGRLSKRRWKEALTEVSAEFQQFASMYRALGWNETLGSSGTIKAIGEIIHAKKWARGEITARSLGQLRDALLGFDHIDFVDLPELNAERRPVLAGGLLVLEAAFNELGLTQMQVAETAMREGVLRDMVGRAEHSDPRAASINALALRYAVDLEQAARVGKTALALFDQVAADWGLDDDDRLMLGWAAQLHELGLVIAHSQYHQHSAYLVQHTDIAGFSTHEQQVLAAILRSHRRTVAMGPLNTLPERLARPALCLIVLLRLSALLHRSRAVPALPAIQLIGSERDFALQVPRRWLDAHPLTRADLSSEVDHLAAVGLSLQLVDEDEPTL